LTGARYPARWALARPKPLVMGEWSHNGYPGRFPLGPEHFTVLSRMTEPAYRGSEASPEGILAYLEAIVPHWRRYGVSGANEWVAQNFLNILAPPKSGSYDPLSRSLIEVVWDRLDTPGIKFFQVPPRGRAVNPGWYPGLPLFDLASRENRYFARYARLWTPVYVFFPDKTRAVYGGSKFERAVCVINDTMSDLKARGKVRLTVGGKAIAEADFEVAVPQGHVRDVPVSLVLPRVAERTGAKVEVILSDQKEYEAVGLELDIFPAYSLSKQSGVLAGLYDPRGVTAAALEKLGIPVEKVSDLKNLARFQVLVIGEEGLDKQVVEGWGGLIDYARVGGKVVVLSQSQSADRLPFDLKRDDVLEVPAVWKRSAGHPLLAGLRDEDFSWWPNDRNDPVKLPGLVASKPYMSPLAGPVRSLLECSTTFDRSALLEYRCGKGSILLTQLRMAGIVGISPPADIFLSRLVYAAEPTLASRQVWYAGDGEGKEFLTERLRYPIKDMEKAGKWSWSERDLIVWMPGEGKSAEKISVLAGEAVKQGAALLVWSAVPKDVSSLAGPPVFRRAVEYMKFPYVLEGTKPRKYTVFSGPFIKMALPDRSNGLTDGISTVDLFRYSDHLAPGKLAEFEIGPENGWRPMAHPAVLAYRKQGKSEQVVCTVVRDPDGKIPEAQERVLHALLTNLGVTGRDLRLAGGGGKYFSIDLSRYCTMGFADAKEDDGKGGWSDQGPENDLRAFPTGRQVFGGIPFDVIDPAKNGGKSCIVLGGGKRLKNLPTRSIGIRFGTRKVSRVHFLHGMAWSGPNPAGEYRVRYVKDVELEKVIPIVTGKNISDWWNPKTIHGASIAWTAPPGEGQIGIYLFTWENPYPEMAVESLDFISQGNGPILGLIAVTGEE
jgi:hypothetical protein